MSDRARDNTLSGRFRTRAMLSQLLKKHGLRIVDRRAVLLVLLVAILSTGTYGDNRPSYEVASRDGTCEGDAGDTFASACPVFTDITYSGNLGDPHPGGFDDDWYQFSVAGGEPITATVTPNPDLGFTLELHDPNSILKASGRGSGQTATVTFTADVSGSWRIHIGFVYAESPFLYDYTFRISVVRQPQNDAGSGGDAGNSFSTATPIINSRTDSGWIEGGEDANDWYWFSASSGQIVTASMTPNSNANFDLQLYNPNNDPKASSTDPRFGQTESVSFAADLTGRWAIRIYQYNAYSTGLYSFSTEVTVTPGPVPDFSISANPDSLSITTGRSGVSTIVVTSVNGFAGTVAFTATGPNGLTPSLSQTSVELATYDTSTATLRIFTSGNVTAGEYGIMVIGTSGSLSHNVIVTVAVESRSRTIECSDCRLRSSTDWWEREVWVRL